MSKPQTPGLTPAELKRRAAQYRSDALAQTRAADQLMDAADSLVNKAQSYELLAHALEQMTERGVVR